MPLRGLAADLATETAALRARPMRYERCDLFVLFFSEASGSDNGRAVQVRALFFELELGPQREKKRERQRDTQLANSNVLNSNWKIR